VKLNLLTYVTDVKPLITALLAQEEIDRPMLSKLVAMCNPKKYKIIIGREGGVRLFIDLLDYQNPKIQKSAVKALHYLSMEGNNCFMISTVFVDVRCCSCQGVNPNLFPSFVQTAEWMTNNNCCWLLFVLGCCFLNLLSRCFCCLFWFLLCLISCCCCLFIVVVVVVAFCCGLLLLLLCCLWLLLALLLLFNVVCCWLIVLVLLLLFNVV